MTQRIDIIGELFTPVAFADAHRHDFPCVYLMAHEQGGSHHIHYAGQTHCLRTRFASHHQLNAAIARGATHALVLVVQSETDRLVLETILRWSLRPPLNAEDVPTHMQAWRAAQHCNKPDIAAQARTLHLNRTSHMRPAWTRTPSV